MGDSPQTYKVTQVQPDGKVWVESFGQPLDLSPKGTTANIGQEVNGWLNPEGKFGPYLKVAEERQQASSNGDGFRPLRGGRNDATGRSIERQVALKAAAEFYARDPKTPVATIVATAEAFDEFLAASARTGGTPPPASPAADPPSAGEGANTPASASTTSDIPDF